MPILIFTTARVADGKIEATCTCGRVTERATVSVADYPTRADAEHAARCDAEDAVAYRLDPVVREGW